MRKLVIFGTRQIAEVCGFYFEHDSDYQVVAYTVDGAFLTAEQFQGRPVVASEELRKQFSPADHDVFVAIGYGKMNGLRASKFAAIKEFGYRCARYVSSKAFTWPGLEIGENTFVMEANVVQPFAVYWSRYDHMVRKPHWSSCANRGPLLSCFAHCRIRRR